VIKVNDKGGARAGAQALASTSIKRSSSSKLCSFVGIGGGGDAKGKPFSHELQAELVRRFSWSHDHVSQTPLSAMALESRADSPLFWRLVLTKIDPTLRKCSVDSDSPS
jgi:hypothetical protein